MKSDLPEKFSRPPYERMLRIHEWIKDGKFPNAVTMGKELEVSDRTVKNDIRHMRDRHHAPIEYEEDKHGYYYAKPYEFLQAAAMSEADMFALLVADKAIAQYKGMPFQQPLRTAFNKLMGNLDDRARYSLENLGLALSFRPFAPEDADLEVFRLITHGLHQRLALKFDYRNWGAKEWKRRHVHPYHLACIDSHWYLFAHDLGRKAIRTFVLTRLKKLVVTDEVFERKTDFNLDEYLKGSLTVMKGEVEEDVVIEFDAWGADLVRGRQWHSSQQATELPDGGLRLQMRLNSLEEIQGWVLSLGIHAKVVSPLALQERVKKIASAVAGSYGS